MSMKSLSSRSRMLSWILQIVAAGIFVMAMIPKFTGPDETRALFEVLGAEPAGRYMVGLMELAAVLLLLIPRTVVFGAIVGFVTIVGAIGSHLTKLGVSIDPETLGQPALEAVAGPSMFVMAVVVFVATAGVLFIRRGQLPVIGPRLAGRANPSG